MGTMRAIVRIKRDGRTEVKVENGDGDNCLAATRAIEAAVGMVESRQRLHDGRDPLGEGVLHREQELDTL